jgi:glycosyltransferase involved in cell wall biosynthesis
MLLIPRLQFEAVHAVKRPAEPPDASEARPNRKIALLCQHFYPEMISTGMHMTELAQALTRQGWQVTVYCAQPSLKLDGHNEAVPREMLHDGIRIVRLAACGSHGGGLAARLLFAVTYLLAAAWRMLVDGRQFAGLVITTNPPFLGLVGRLVRLVLGKPYVLIVYDVYPEIVVRLGILGASNPVVWLWRQVSRCILRGAAANVVIGRDMAEIIGQKLRAAEAKRMHLIPNWSDDRVVKPVAADENRFRREHVPHGKLVVQYSGRMGSTHNLEPLIEAAEILADRNVWFQFIGDGAKKKRLEALVRQKGLPNVQFLPYQPLENLCEVLSAADLAVVCLESLYTGLSVPSKTYGVMASGVPILAFLDPASEIGRTIAENDCGVILSDPTGRQVAETIERLMAQPGRLAEMGARGYRTFKRQYTLEHAGRRYSELLAHSFSPSQSARAA